jgi:hypothetical protein
MRKLIIGATALLAGCATQAVPHQPVVASASPPDKVEVYHHAGMSYSVDAGGEGRFKAGDEERIFPVSREEYERFRTLLQPYRQAGLLCDEPGGYRWEPGYFLWRENGVETRRRFESHCYTDAYKAADDNADRVYYDLRDMADERRAPPPVLPAPDRLALTSLYWGRVTEEWSVPRGGEARWTKGDEIRTFAVSDADFDRLRDLFRPYEGVRFECQRIITDGPYGQVTWSQEGHEDQQLKWDAGCVTGDAADVFRRWDEAVVLLKALRDGG